MFIKSVLCFFLWDLLYTLIHLHFLYTVCFEWHSTSIHLLVRPEPPIIISPFIHTSMYSIESRAPSAKRSAQISHSCYVYINTCICTHIITTHHGYIYKCMCVCVVCFVYVCSATRLWKLFQYKHVCRGFALYSSMCLFPFRLWHIF